LTAGATGEINNNPRYYHQRMAKRKYSMAKQKKMDPAVMTISFNLPSVSASQTGISYLDLSQMASLVNRRFYRQGINWAVSGFKVYSAPATSGQLNIKKIPNTWVAFQAYKKAFDAWNTQQMEAIEEAGAESAVARFRDFKVFADANHVDQYIANGSDLNATNLLPVDGAIVTYATGEWQPSEIVIPNVDGISIAPAEYLLHMVGVNNNGGLSRGIIEGYADSRAFPQSPDPVSPVIGSGQNWLRDMFDVGNDSSEITTNATDRNDELPYPQADYPGGETQAPNLELHDIVRLSGTTVGGTSRGKGGMFPCGLMRLEFSNTGDSAIQLAIQIDMVPGTHRGYLCEKMLGE